MRTSNYVAKDCLPEVFLDLLKPIFTDLSTDKLRRKCDVCAVQNGKVSIIRLVWQLCQKNKCHGASTVQLAVATAILQFSGGFSMTAQLMENMGTPLTTLSKKNMFRSGKNRII